MAENDALEIAHMMMRRHGLQARAVAFERTQEMRLAGDVAGLDRWQQVLSAIADRRHAAPARPSADAA
ncbi:MAG: hypothetical protein KGL52_14340 [Rhodospirillales bacterium]|jgi:hypothetical protein|nr:hypothetical protein [Rhodospirillales bacterium]